MITVVEKGYLEWQNSIPTMLSHRLVLNKAIVFEDFLCILMKFAFSEIVDS